MLQHLSSINTDQWGQLPPPGHYLGIPHIIGGKLVVIGERLFATKKRTNKVSTFDEVSQTWKYSILNKVNTYYITKGILYITYSVTVEETSRL